MKISNTFKILFCILAGAFVPIWIWYVVSVPDLLRQYRAQSFPETKGQVLSAGIVLKRASGKVFYLPAYSYKYEVNGASYKGRRYRYLDYLSDFKSASRLVAAHPAGSAVEVYYNPDNPADSVLSPLVVARDISQLLLSAPFLYLALFLLLKFGRAIDWPGKVKPVAGGVKIMTEMMMTRVRLVRYQPGWLGLGTTCVLSLIAGFVIPFAGASAPIPAGLFAFIITIGAGALAYYWQHRRIASGIQDLVIAESARTLELPLTRKRRERRLLAFSDIKAVTVEKVAHQGQYGVTFTYAPTLQLRDGSSEPLIDFDRDKAESFAAWLREKLGIQSPEIPPGTQDNA